jgi:hypothetical protein
VVKLRHRLAVPLARYRARFVRAANPHACAHAWVCVWVGTHPHTSARCTGMLFVYKSRADVAAGLSQGSVRLAGATLMARKVCLCVCARVCRVMDSKAD